MNYKYTTLAVLNALLLIYMSSLPEYSVTGSNSVGEKIVSNAIHIPAYAVLSFLWFKSFKVKEGLRLGMRVSIFIFIALVLFAISDEVHQSFVPGRTASVIDVVLDVLGIGLGLAVYRHFKLNILGE